MKKRRFFPPPSEPLGSADGGWDQAGLYPQHCVVRLEPNPSSKEQKRKKKPKNHQPKNPKNPKPQSPNRQKTNRKKTPKKPKQRLKKEQRPVFALTPLKAQFEDP